MKETKLRIKSGDLTLEGLLYAPADEAPKSVVVVCHPHPQRGGEMRNNVVMGIVRALLDGGIGALTFNFRGVGASEGSHDNGVGERDDVRAALACARSLDGVERVGLAGYSFGAARAAEVVDDAVVALALVGVNAAALGGDSMIVSYKGPVLMLSGDADHVSNLDALRDAAKALPGVVEIVGVPGVDHFWWGHEPTLCDIVGPFFRSHLAPATA